jgi:hypothetical protein
MRISDSAIDGDTEFANHVHSVAVPDRSLHDTLALADGIDAA